MAKQKKKDWRSLPRKPAAHKRSESRGIRFSPTELENLKKNAAAANMSDADFIVFRCCQPEVST